MDRTWVCAHISHADPAVTDFCLDYVHGTGSLCTLHNTPVFHISLLFGSGQRVVTSHHMQTAPRRGDSCLLWPLPSPLLSSRVLCLFRHLSFFLVSVYIESGDKRSLEVLEQRFPLLRDLPAPPCSSISCISMQTFLALLDPFNYSPGVRLSHTWGRVEAGHLLFLRLICFGGLQLCVCS